MSPPPGPFQGPGALRSHLGKIRPERVPTGDWGLALRGDGAEHRELLRAIDAVKKRTQRARRCSSAVEAVADDREPYTRQLDEDREALARAAEELLSARQQRILT